MNFLYGDSTPSRLTSNFLEFLRDAMDFAVFVLDADDRIKRGKARIRQLGEDSKLESSRLDAFVKNVTKAIAETDKGPPSSATAQCASRIIAMAAEAQRATNSALQAQLIADSAEVDAEEASLRHKCYEALATLLAPHDPPDTAVVTRIALGPTSAAYGATLTGRAAFGLEWECNLAIPEGHLWASPVRIDRLVPQLEIHAPQLTGWISKEVKVKPQRIERHVVSEMVDDRTTIKFALVEPGQEVGFGFEVNIATHLVKAERTGPATQKGLGPFDIDAEEAKMLVELATKLRASHLDLERAELTAARAFDRDFGEQPSFVPFVEKLIGTLAPIVQDIAEHSLAPTELVLRRMIGDGRREEIFVAKATLREKYASLPEPLRALFAPLRLEDARVGRRSAAPSNNDRPDDGEKRAELAPSRPPPPPAPSQPQAPPLPPMRAPKPMPPVRPPATTTPGFPPPSVAPNGDHSHDDPVVTVEHEPLLPPQNENLTAELKRINTLSKNGRAEEAFVAFGQLFESVEFASYRPDEQRRALRLMISAPSPEKGPLVTHTHRAALGWIRGLVEREKEPSDHEMLGITLLALDEPNAAKEAFQAGLERERARDAESELAETLAEQVRAIQ